MVNEERKYSFLYYKRRLKANKMKRGISAKRRQLRFHRVLLRLFLITSMIALALYTLKLPMWHISQVKLMNNPTEVVQIKGNKITPSEKIYTIVENSELKDVGLYRLKTKKLQENIAQLSPVKNVYIRRFWLPARLLIVINEREPKFLIAEDLSSEPASIVTNDGVFIGRDYMASNNKFSAIKILSYGTKGEDYAMWNKERVNKIDKIIKIIEAYSKQHVKYIDLRNPNDIYVQLDEVMLRIGAIDDTTEKRLEFLVTLMPQVPTFKQRIKYLDLRWAETCYIKLNSNQNSSQ